MAGVDSFSRFRDFVARPLGGGGEVRCQGSSRAAAGEGGSAGRGETQVFSDATSEMEISPEVEAIYSGGNYAALPLTQVLITLCGTEQRLAKPSKTVL